MAGSSSSAVSRYRPAILFVTGTAAVYAAWLLYTSVTGPPPVQGLQRRNAIRRSLPRSRSRMNLAIDRSHLWGAPIPLGEARFFGSDIVLDGRLLFYPDTFREDALREIGAQLDPTASPDVILDAIRRVYITFFDRLLEFGFPDRALARGEEESLFQFVGDHVVFKDALVQALNAHRERLPLSNAAIIPPGDGSESVAETVLSWDSDDHTETGNDEEAHTLQRTLYYIAEDRARHEGVVHRGIECNACGMKPLRGVRWRCANCNDFDLCSDCEATNCHVKTHIFYKVRVPAAYTSLPKQEPVYPGRPTMMPASFSSILKRRLLTNFSMEIEEVEALWDQFTCLAATEWHTDPNEVGWAFDRRAFNHAFIPRFSNFVSAPNLVYDRVFSFFDTDGNGLIGFEEFIKGIDGLHSQDVDIRTEIVFKSYDIDGDGFISRKDVLRVLRAYYAIEQEATRNYLTETAEELSVRGALETIQSARPLGSAFAHSPSSNGNSSSSRNLHKDEELDSLEPIEKDHQDDTSRRDMLMLLDETGSEDLIRERWDRRQFYIDEEEGLGGLEVDDIPDAAVLTDDDRNGTPNSGLDRVRGSRSSSRVRFQDDVDLETRSNASTSSRPIGERWGSYEIPEVEKDLGLDIMYQITQHAINELLDPLFKDKEDIAMMSALTDAERRTQSKQIDTMIEPNDSNPVITTTVQHMGPMRYVSWMLCELGSVHWDRICESQASGTNGHVVLSRDSLRKSINDLYDRMEQKLEQSDLGVNQKEGVSKLTLWETTLLRCVLKHEIINAVDQIATWKGCLAPLSPRSDAARIRHASSQESVPSAEHFDPIFPQFRPNSSKDLEARDPDNNVIDNDDSTYESSDDKRVPAQAYSSPVFVLPKRDWAVACNTTESPSPEHTSKHGVMNEQTQTVESPRPTSDFVRSRLPVDRSGDYFTDPNLPPPLYYIHIDQSWNFFFQPTDSMHPPDVYMIVDSLRTIREQVWRDPSSPAYMLCLVQAELAHRELKERGGPGRLDYEEFKERLQRQGDSLKFLSGWMDWVSF